MNEYETKYLAEIRRWFHQAGFAVEPEEDGRLVVEQGSQRLCRVDAKG